MDHRFLIHSSADGHLGCFYVLDIINSAAMNNIYFCFIDYAKAFDCVDHNKLSNGVKVKEESEKVGLKLNIQKTKVMASCPITSWQIDGETVRDFIFWGAPKLFQMMTAAMKLKDGYFLEGKL